jgi:hypothetical protein
MSGMRAMERVGYVARSLLITLSMALAIMVASLATPTPVKAQTVSVSPLAPQNQTYVGWFGSWFTWLGGWFDWSEKTIEADLTAFRDLVVEDIEHVEKLVARSGFSLEEARIGAGLIPSVDLDIAYERALTAEEKAALVDYVDTSGEVGPVERVLIEALLDLADFQEAKKNHSMTLTDVEMAVDLIPHITIILKRSDR